MPDAMIERFFRKWDESREWFRNGLFIASSDDEIVLPALKACENGMAGIAWDLVGRRDYDFSFSSRYLVQRTLGGLRLYWAARHTYDVVALCWPREKRLRELRLHCWFAFLVMRPQRFFVFTEGGHGFWLSVDNEAVVRYHFPRSAKIWDLLRFGEKNVCYLAWKLGIRVCRLAGGLVLFLGGVFLLLFFRMFYDTYDYRYRFLGKLLASPRQSRHETASCPRPDGHRLVDDGQPDSP